jgi:hypothetical protein
VGGEIIQRATVVGCKAGDNPQELVLARYPALPMSFDRVCAGFKDVLLNWQTDDDLMHLISDHHQFTHHHFPHEQRQAS